MSVLQASLGVAFFAVSIWFYIHTYEQGTDISAERGAIQIVASTLGGLAGAMLFGFALL